MEILKGATIQREDLETTHEEADVTIPQQVVDAVTRGSKCIKVICDGTGTRVHLVNSLLSEIPNDLRTSDGKY